MKILLLFPPDWLPSEPYLSLPALTSVLRPAGHEVLQKDINVEMYDMFFSRPFLEQVSSRITVERNHLFHVEKKRALDEEESTLKEQLVQSTPDKFDRLAYDAEKAKNILRGDSFYDIDQLEWATNTLHETMALISLGYYPAQICFPPIETDLVYKPFMSSEILEALDDDQINVYRGVYHQLIAPILKKENIPAAIGTSGPEENVSFILEEFNWRSVFHSLVHRNRFKMGKPAPDCFLVAAEELGQPPDKTVVFEDSVHGLMAANRGGFTAAAIASTHEPAELTQYTGWVFRDFRSLSC